MTEERITKKVSNLKIKEAQEEDQDQDGNSRLRNLSFRRKQEHSRK
jgi:hypothetical protein